MANQETPEKRPACDWDTDRGKPQQKTCGSEENLFKVRRHTVIGGARDHNICGKHLERAWGKWTVESAEKLYPSKTTGCAI